MELFKLLGTIAIQGTDVAKDEIDDVTGKAEKSSNKMVEAFKKIGAAVTTFFAVDKIKDFGLACVNAAADANAMNSQFSQVFGELESKASGSLSEIAKQAGITENRMKGSFTKIAAFAKTTGMETEDSLALAERAMVAVADSAAFYDRSLEETTESLQSFLKGNYENDSALGLSCTEVTRNTAANKLYGKSFNELSEAQKQLTLLQMVEDANAASGALGQAARESDTWTNQVGNLKQAWTDFQAKVGEKVLPKVIEAVKWLANVVTEMGNQVDPIFQMLQTAFEKLYGVATDMAEFWPEVLEPAFMAVGDALLLVWEAIEPVVQSFTDLIPEVETSKTFMDYFRDACFAVEEALFWVADKLTAVSNWITQNQPLVEGIIIVLGSLGAAWVVVNGAIAAYTTAATIASTVTGVLTGAATAMGGVIAFLTSPIGIAVAAVTALIAIGVALYKNWDEVKAKASELASAISDKFDSIKQGITDKINAAKEAVKSAIDKIKGFFDFQWELPKLKMPHFTINGSFSLNPPSVPSIGVDWYAKAMENPMIMDKPTAFGINSVGQIMAGGEAGSEVVSGTETLMQMIAAAVASKNAKLEELLQSILAFIVEYMPQLANMQIVTDTGALIGELAPGMDDELGRIASRKDRQ